MGKKRDKAMKVIKGMMPPEAVKALENPPQGGFGAEIGELAMVSVMEPMWTREGIDLKTRSLVTCAILIALRAHHELQFHAPAAIRNGATVAELEEVLYHAAGYAGFPAAVSGRDAIDVALKQAKMI